MPNIGPMEIGILLVVALLVFGPKKLPELGRGLGKGMREFKVSVTGEPDEDAPELTRSTADQAASQQRPAGSKAAVSDS